MPALTTQEHRQAQREAKTRRNASARNGRAALARAWAWIEAMGAQVTVEATPAGALYTVKVPGFHAQSARWLPAAVAALQGNIEHFCDSRATHGPTGARLDALRAKRAAYTQRSA